MDGVTASVLLSALKGGAPNDEIADIYKSIKQSNQDSGDGPPSPEVIAFLQTKMGNRCRIKATSYVGTMKAINMTDSGFYPGSRFPAYIAIDKTNDGRSHIFEYQLDQIEWLDFNDQPLPDDKAI